MGPFSPCCRGSNPGGCYIPPLCYSLEDLVAKELLCLGWGHALLSLWPSAPSPRSRGALRNEAGDDLAMTKPPVWRGRQALLTQVFPEATRSRLVAEDHHATFIIKILE